MEKYSNALLYQDQHVGWTQRINKELGASNKFSNLLQTQQQQKQILSKSVNLQSFQNLKGNEPLMKIDQANQPRNSLQKAMATTKGSFGFINQYERLNQDQRDVKQKPFYHIDSTYVIACNPNTMRDIGPRIGATQYNFHSGSSQNGSIKPPRSAYSTRAQNQLANNSKAFSSVTVKDAIVDKFNTTMTQERVYFKPMYYTFTKIHANNQTRATVPSKSQHVIIDEKGTPLIHIANRPGSQRICGYTKNISGQIFNPSLTQHVHGGEKVIKKRSRNIYSSQNSLVNRIADVGKKQVVTQSQGPSKSRRSSAQNSSSSQLAKLRSMIDVEKKAKLRLSQKIQRMGDILRDIEKQSQIN